MMTDTLDTSLDACLDSLLKAAEALDSAPLVALTDARRALAHLTEFVDGLSAYVTESGVQRVVAMLAQHRAQHAYRGDAA